MLYWIWVVSVGFENAHGKYECILFHMKNSKKYHFLPAINLWLTAVGSIDTSGISMFEEVKKNLDRRGLKVHSFFLV